ncbi:hypothetical protein F5J12DRAFT_787259 [Pisolithus orientalis]|uniref:uncharacterized protein n=1 Tax=Pisolithus orientalis TaxID=936130 RepID=UPI0022242101|nr:uncharacterized protein F5J12DRAFT_787259 [Pisolithus orientalis]KAI5986269.1 hypothetical protein F5J12DRAFT_787259 [Pisolithus orientalis]
MTPIRLILISKSPDLIGLQGGLTEVPKVPHSQLSSTFSLTSCPQYSTSPKLASYLDDNQGTLNKQTRRLLLLYTTFFLCIPVSSIWKKKQEYNKSAMALCGGTESRNALLAQLASLMGPLPPPPVSKPQAIISPMQPVNAPPVDVIQDKLAPVATTALVDHTPMEPMPMTVIVQDLDPSPALDLPTFNMLPDIPSSMSMSMSTVALSCTPSPSLPGPLDPPPPLTPTTSPDHPTSISDAAMLADPTTPTHQVLNASEPGPDHLPADSPLTGHTSLDCPSVQNVDHLGESGLQWHVYWLDWHIKLIEHTSKDSGFPIYPPIPCNWCHVA